MPFDPTKPVGTKDGRAARILRADLKGLFPIVAAIVLNDGYEIVCRRRANGRVNGDDKEQHPGDLVNIPEKRTVSGFINVYDNGIFNSYFHSYLDRASADAYAANRIACKAVTLEYEVGEGVSATPAEPAPAPPAPDPVEVLRRLCEIWDGARFDSDDFTAIWRDARAAIKAAEGK